MGVFLVFHTALKVTKIAEKYLTNVNRLCIFYMIASFLASIKNTESILLTISFTDSFIFNDFYKVSRSKKKKCRFCRLACYVRRNRQCFLISYADRSFLKLFRAGSCILVSYSCRDLFKSVDFLTRK